MALPNPPQITPRIVKVVDPGDKQYLVMVRMPTEIAARYPDKPWGTPIEKIGLSPKDAELYKGYVLVDSEDVQGTPDLYWVFQKLDGAIWTTKMAGQDSLIPAKYRRLVLTVIERNDVTPDTEVDPIDGDRTKSVVQREPNSGRAIKENTFETINTDGAPLEGSETDTWGMNTTEERLGLEGDLANSGFGVKGSQSTPLGNGKAIISTVYYPPDDDDNGIIYSLYDQEIDDTNGIVIDIDKHLVDAARAKAIAEELRGLGYYPKIQAIDKWHSILVAPKVDASTVPDEESWTEGGNFSLPNLLKEVGIVWDAVKDSNGSSVGVVDVIRVEDENLQWDASAEVFATGNVTGRPYTLVENGRSGIGTVTVTRTFHFGPPTDSVDEHEFRPVYGVLTIMAENAIAQARNGLSGRGDVRAGKSVSLKSFFNADITIHQFGPVEFGATPTIVHKGDLTDGGPPVLTDSASATAGSLPGAGTYPAATASIAARGKATLEMPPSSQPLISGNSYVLKVDSRPWRFGWWVREVYLMTIP